MVHEQRMSEGQEQQLESARQALSQALARQADVGTVLSGVREPRIWLYGRNDIDTRFFIDTSGMFLQEA
jgi:hypothetical protein